MRPHTGWLAGALAFIHRTAALVTNERAEHNRDEQAQEHLHIEFEWNRIQAHSRQCSCTVR